MIELSCEYCETKFSRYPSQVTDGRVFCSRKCCNDWQAEVGTTKRERKWSQEEMMDCPDSNCSFESGSIHGLAAHWGMTHDGSPPWKEHECDKCGEEFVRPNSQIYTEKTFCGLECRNEALRNGELREYPERQEIPDYGDNWNQQREKAIERDGGECTYDGCEKEKCEFGHKLHVHHITPIREFESPTKANQLENLRTLCAEHHMIIENQ